MERAERVIEIDAPVERVFNLFSDFESFPRWMHNIKEVRYTGPGYTRWTADAPFGFNVEWEAKTTAFEPNRRIAWRSVRGDVDTEGEVNFQETSRRTTLLRVLIGYNPPAGHLGAMVAKLFGTDPEKQLAADLDRFAEVVERDRRSSRRVRREPEEAPARERREYIREQIERRRRDAYDYPSGRTLYDERGGYEPHYARYDREGRDSASQDRRYREPADYRSDSRHDEPSFEEALRAARRSQHEGMRRYRHERERHEERRFDERRERDRERWANNDDEDGFARERDWPTPRRRAEDYRQPAGQHAMTPRERELERGRRRADDEYSRIAFRRGVDKLMDEPPSDRWRRWSRSIDDGDRRREE